MLPSGTAASGAALRLGIRVTGVVQGVGFRPAVFRLAESLGLAGFVRNDGVSVWIEVLPFITILLADNPWNMT